MRIALASDACTPRVNGVVTPLKATAASLVSLGHEVHVLHPQELPCPSYPKIRLALAPGVYVARELAAFRPQAIPVATEGPLGLAVRRFCLARRVPFTSSYHTRYPKSLRARWPIPLTVSYTWLRRFHGAAARTLVGSPPLQRELTRRGSEHLHLWRRGVDLGGFHPREATPLLAGLARPILACVGRLAVEKNLEAFLGLRDVIEPGVTGVLHADLAVAISAALRLDRRACAARARAFSWRAASAQCLDGLTPIPPTRRAAVAVGRSSAMIERIAARRQPSQAGDAN